MRRRFSMLAAALVTPLPLAAQALVPDSVRESALTAPLFASHDLLTLTIEAPLTTIFKDRGENREEYPGTVVLHAPGGAPVSFDAEIRVRGKTRSTRRICEFPPLRLDFDRSEVTTTLFRGQDKLKLVGHCQDSRREYEQYVLQEYLVYRVFSTLTPLSFRARLARITYVDTDAKRDTVERYGFLLEDAAMMAARNGWVPVTASVIPPEFVDPPYLALLEVFEYMIGNLDWSAFRAAPEEEECCHNTVPVGGSAGPVFPVPYDFDIAGVINTRYADRLFQPRERNLGTATVRERAYRGLCASTPELSSVFALLKQRQPAIYGLYREQRDLAPEVLEETLKYYDEFYALINDPQEVRREFESRCR